MERGKLGIGPLDPDLKLLATKVLSLPQIPGQAILVYPVEKFLLTRITVTATLNTHTALTKETVNSPFHSVTVLMTSERDCAFTFFTFMKITALTNVPSVVKAFHSHQASTSICGYTVVIGHTNVLTVSGPLLLHQFCARTYVSTAEKNRLSANIAAALSLRMQLMTVTCDGNITYNNVTSFDRHLDMFLLR